MTALVAALLLALVCWVLRVLFVAVVPASRLPAGVREALDHLAPAVLASLVAVELVGVVRGSPVTTALLMLTGIVVAGLLARRTGSLALAVGVAAVVALVVDLALAG
jgi:branched-subunit amino acid transport protein